MSKRTVFIGLLTVNINNNTVPNNIQRLAENRFLNLLPENQLKIISTLNIPTINQVLDSHSTMRVVVDRLPQNLLNQINAHDRENNVIYRGGDGHVRINLGDDTDVQRGITALMAAARDGSLERITALIAARESVNHVDHHGVTALMLAARNENPESVRALVNVEGIEVNHANDGATALMLAARMGYTESVRALVNVEGIEVNHADNYGFTALMRAAYNGHTESVRALVNVEGIEVNHADGNGFTALMYAAARGHTESVTPLRNAGAVDRVSESSCCVIS